VVNAELVRAVTERDAARGSCEAARAAAADAEAHVAAKAKELDDLVAAYRALGHENQRLAAAAKGLQRDLQRHTADSHSQADELQVARETVTRVEEENRQYVADLQAFERQADTLTRELHRLADAADSADTDRNTLASQLGAAKGVSLQTERSREALLRELAASDAAAAALKARLEEARGEVATLAQRLAAESDACGKLQALLETVRGEQHKVQVSHADAGKRGEVYLERAHTLEEQTATLRRQVAALTAAGAASSREMEELNTALTAAAAEAAAASVHRHGSDLAGFASRTAQAEATTAAQARAVAALEAERAALAQQLAVSQMEVAELHDALAHANGDLRHLTNLKMELEDNLVAAQRNEAAAVADKARAASDARADAEARAAADGQSVAAAVNARAAAAERRAVALEAELHAAAAATGRSAAAAADSVGDVAALHAEKQRLETVVARWEHDGLQLRREVTRLQLDANTLRQQVAAAGEGGGEDVERLKRALQRSEAKRDAVENDFRDLVAGLELSSGGMENTEAAAELLASKLDALQVHTHTHTHTHTQR
jgi:DNA repair exonuclease SbcCD ATPase subunit